MSEDVRTTGNVSATESMFTKNIRPLTAEEYYEILKNSDVELRVSDGTREGTWRFWCQGTWLFYRRLSDFGNKRTDTDFLETILDGDGTTQLVTGGRDE